MLGKTVYFCDLKDRMVREGVVLSQIISQSGYVVSIIKSEVRSHTVEQRLIFKEKEKAEERLPMLLSIKDEMDRREKRHNECMDKMRIRVIGKPEYKDIADAYIK